jgi:hypothetical protein
VWTPHLAPVPWPVALTHRPEPAAAPSRRRAIDVNGVITRALTAAGLMKAEPPRH